MPKEERTKALALHNLYILSKEVKSINEAILEGRLWEYTGIKARAHPSLWQAFRSIEEHVDFLEDGTPLFKNKAIFLFGPPDHKRPEVVRSTNSIIKNIEFPRGKTRLLIFPEGEVTPFYNSAVYRHLTSGLGNLIEKAQVSFVVAPFGLIPVEISDVYPFSQYVSTLELTGIVEQTTIENSLKVINSWQPKRTVLLDDGGRYTKLLNKLASGRKNSILLSLTDGDVIVKAVSRLLTQ